MIASYNGSATFGESIGDALGKLFPEFDTDLVDRVDIDGAVPGSGTGDTSGSGSTTTTAPTDSSGPSTTGGTATTSPGSTATTPEELLAEANRLFGEADTALKDGDLGGYQTKVT